MHELKINVNACTDELPGSSDFENWSRFDPFTFKPRDSGALWNVGAKIVPKILIRFSCLEHFFRSSNFLFFRQFLDRRFPNIFQLLFEAIWTFPDIFRRFRRFLRRFWRCLSLKQFYAALTIFSAPKHGELSYPKFSFGGATEPPGPPCSAAYETYLVNALY